MCVSFPFRIANGILSPGGKNARLSILIYHRVLPQADPLLPDVLDAARFSVLMRALRSAFTVLPLSEAVRRLQEGTLPARAACITFDDGYTDNATVALPLLQQLGLPAAFFVSPAYLNGGRMWNDTVYETVRRLPAGSADLSIVDQAPVTIDDAPSRHRLAEQVIRAVKHLPPAQRQQKVDRFTAQVTGLPADLMMNDAQLRTLHAAGMEIGAHTMTHPILAKTENAVAEEEIRGSKLHLENLLQTEINLFAYPNGRPVEDYLPQHVRMVKTLGFKAAVSTAWGSADRNSDLFQLPRFTPWEHDRLRFMTRLSLNLRQRQAGMA